MTDKEKTIRWFESIADECDKLTSGNVAHLRVQIKGMAIRSAEYLTKHCQEPAGEDFESEWKRYSDSKGGGAVTMNIKDVAKHFTEWQKTQDRQTIELAEEHAMLAGMMQEREQMMKDAIEGKVVAVRTTMSDKLHTYPWVELETQLSKNDKVKVIIIKE